MRREGEGEEGVVGVLEEGEGDGGEAAHSPGLPVHPARQSEEIVDEMLRRQRNL